MERAGEGAAAKQLHRVGALLGKIGERDGEIAVQFLARDVSGPRVHRHVADLEIVAQRKAAKHRQPAEEIGDVPVEDGLGLRGFHGLTMDAAGFARVSRQISSVTGAPGAVVTPACASATLPAMRTTTAVALFASLCLWVAAAGAADIEKPLILVAKPELRDRLYGSSVLVVTPLGADQHVGFIVNRPTGATLSKLFPEHAPSQKVPDPVYLGGPVEPGLIFALVQRASSPGGNSFELMPGLFAAFEAPVVDRIIESEADHARFMAGIVAWRAGELKSEIDLGAWYVLEPDAELVMREPAGLWEELVRRSQRLRNTI